MECLISVAPDLPHGMETKCQPLKSNGIETDAHRKKHAETSNNDENIKHSPIHDAIRAEPGRLYFDTNMCTDNLVFITYSFFFPDHLCCF